jgi:hypothetical protein
MTIQAFRTGLAAALLASSVSFPAAGEQGRIQVAQSCGWYAIFSCACNPQVGGPGYVIDTNEFPNFRPGYWCNVIGPSDYYTATRNARSYGGYAKQAC